jgi:hypothetical protein
VPRQRWYSFARPSTRPLRALKNAADARRERPRMSLDDTFSENAPTVGPQIRTLRLVEHVKPEQEQAYLEWSREFSDAHANFIAARDPESWSSVVMIRDRAFGRNDVRYIKVFRFPDDAIFEAWTASEERREMIRKGLALNFAVDENALERAAASKSTTRPRFVDATYSHNHRPLSTQA